MVPAALWRADFNIYASTFSKRLWASQVSQVFININDNEFFFFSRLFILSPPIIKRLRVHLVLPYYDFISDLLCEIHNDKKNKIKYSHCLIPLDVTVIIL